MTERSDFVTPGELASKIETVEAKLSTLRWQMIAALVGGQAVAGATASLVTRTTPDETAALAVRAVLSFF